MMRGTLLLLWGLTLLWSFHSGRLDLLLRGVFHGLVGFTGLMLVMFGVALLLKRSQPQERWRWPWLLSGLMAALVLIVPPNPSFSDLASNRPQGLPDPPELAFVLPPDQRSLTEWVRYLRSQPDPDLVDGNPVSISGFVWRQPQGSPLIARLTVRCCLADATPAGLAVAWPDGFTPKTNQWLALKGTMSVQRQDGRRIPVVVPSSITPIARPERPLEP
ncbi:TIGR03943 family protein [Synechococcus sp. KORDI-52]|uniref:TIGR03943 family putative permease subunit n=1 Tax=Synechococcus sp. KORDI-52 TaxID=585425 RepID=UPI00056EA4B2|nr:TIGR03943 family protein [Synechococcus sp. KORDI-52]